MLPFQKRYSVLQEKALPLIWIKGSSHIGILKLADVWHRRHSSNAKSPPNERWPL
jgi:hypothetical protein